MKRLINILTPILFLALGIGIIFFFEFYLKDKVDAEEVIVATQDIAFKERITEDMIEVVNVRQDRVVNQSFPSHYMDELIGSYAGVDIKAGTQLYDSLIDTFDLIPNEEEGEFIASIPSDWIYAAPPSLRRTFVADFYVIGPNDKAEIQSYMNEDNDQTETNLYDTTEDATEFVQELGEPILKNIRLSSVRDSSNREIGKSQDEKASSTGTVTTLEFVANHDMLEELHQYVQSDFKLYVVYKYSIPEHEDKDVMAEKESETE